MASSSPDRAAVKPLRFCMVTTFYPPHSFGGDGIAVQRLARALVRWGHDVTVIHDPDAYRTLSGHQDSRGDRVEDGVEVVPVRRRVPPVSMFMTHQRGRPVLQVPPLRDLLDGGDYDVINFHNISLVGGPGVLAYGDAVKLYTAHEHWLVCPTHVLWRHGREPCDRRECLRCTLRSRRPPQLWRYTGYLERQLSHVHKFIALSDFSRRKHHEFGFPREMEVVPQPVPDRDPASPSATTPHPRPYVIFAGRVERLKGLDDVLPLFRDGSGADLLIAGTGTHEPALRKIANGSPRVRFLGQVSPGQLSQYYRGALALIMPSVGFETFGLTVVEAFRQSLPVVARAVGPLPELIAQSDGGGLLFTSAAELDAALDRVASEPALRKRMGEAGRSAFERRWSERAVVPRYLDVVAGATSLRRAASEGTQVPA